MNIINGTIFDIVLILAACLIGLFFRSKAKRLVSLNLFKVMALAALVSGIGMGLKSTNILLPMLALIGGVIIGDVLKVETKFRKRYNIDSSMNPQSADVNSIGKAFVTASMFSLIGPMAIVGSLQNGYNKDPSILLIKGGFDFVTTLVITLAMGRGTALSIIPVFFVQSLLSLLGVILGPFLTTQLLDEITATGGLILIALGLSLLGVKGLKVLSMLLGVFLIPILYYISHTLIDL